MLIAVVFIIAKIGKQPKCPLKDEWIKKVRSICTREYYSASKKKEILLFATTWVDVEDIISILSEMSQTQKNKYCMISLVCGIYKS